MQKQNHDESTKNNTIESQRMYIDTNEEESTYKQLEERTPQNEPFHFKPKN